MSETFQCKSCQAELEPDTVWDTVAKEMRRVWVCSNCGVSWVEKDKGKLGVVIQ